MPMPQKIVSTSSSNILHTNGLAPLPKFPSSPEYNCEYLKVINPEVEAGIVKNSSREEAKINKLRLSIAFLNLYRLNETLSELER